MIIYCRYYEFQNDIEFIFSLITRKIIEHKDKRKLNLIILICKVQSLCNLRLKREVFTFVAALKE